MSNSRKYIIALIAALGLFPVVLDTTIVSIGLVPIANAMQSDLNTVQWILTGYLLALAISVAAGGYLGNMFGVKRLFLLGIGLFTFFSLLIGFAPNMELLIAFRVLQGLGGGFLLTLGQSIAFEQFPAEERARASAVVALPILLAPIFGPILGGALLDSLGWPSIFFINVPVGVLVVLLGLLLLPGDNAPVRKQGARFDWPGLLLVGAGVTAIIYGVKLVTETQPGSIGPLNPLGSVYGWGYGPVWLWLGGGALLLAAFALYTLFLSTDPVLDLRLYRTRDFLSSTLVFVASTVVTFGLLLLIPVFLQRVRIPQLSAFDSGVTLVPLGAAALLGVVVCARLYDTVGPRVLVIVGSALTVLGLWQLGNLTPTSGGSEIWPWLVAAGVGLAMTTVPVQTLALQRLSGPTLSKGTSLFMTARLVFASVGSAVLTTLFIQQATTHGDTLKAAALSSLPAGVTPDPRNPLVQEAIKRMAAQAGTMGVNDVLGYVAVGAALMILLAFLLPARERVQVGQRNVIARSGPEIAGL
ncbi:MAG: MFS transporter [Thermaceae bacterium]|nr:MFS transporter [Thermaceae bacterium]